ncbi:MAG: sigma-54-dependent Fis family transcriptional regulator [Desulfovibrio sp.]|uniref:sigma-54-dependent Fis family transcriptional regulator n=1 Tax=Desulfovibrio sp. 7SRBS1 TaxID=3378064 RepID=UPI003B3C34AE
MYTLVWDKQKYDIQQEPLPPARRDSHRDVASRQPFMRASQGRVNRNDWEAFMEKGRVDKSDLDSTLLDSWRRCRDMGVDPSPRKCWDILPFEQLEPSAKKIRSLTRDVETNVYEAIKGRNLLITITNAEGYVVRTCGDLSTLRHADTLNFGPGANWSESSVGTNAIGTCLTTGRPVQVFGQEHYCQNHHIWNCTAAPIFDPNGNTVGCFDISGPATADHSRSMGLVLDAVRSLEKRLFRMQAAEMGHQSCSLLSTVFNSVLTGMLAVDCYGRISNSNSAAAALLGLAPEDLEGREADLFFEFDAFLGRRKHATAQGESLPLPCRKRPGLVCRATPAFSLNGTWFGTVVTLMEPQRKHVQNPMRPAPEQPKEIPTRMPAILGNSPALNEAVDTSLRAARTPSTVLLTGESGTGKELFARGIHKASLRADKPFVAVNCGALPDELVQSELFGYASGAFTGADKKGRPGKFEQANGGTLFLDEISEMPLSMQVNLLRVLEERQVTPVGGSQVINLNIKVIAATNRDLTREVAEGRFRKDLYYRLNVVHVHIPPLRERGDDAAILAEYQAYKLAEEFGLDLNEISHEAMALLLAHDWPGNVRELFNTVEYALNNLNGPKLLPEHLPPALQKAEPDARPESTVERTASLRLKDMEAEAIRRALSRYHGNVSKAARALGIGRNTLYAKMRQYGITQES